MELPVYNTTGDSQGTVKVSDRLFGARINADTVYQVATSLMSNKRQVLAHAKTRSEVAGGGKKPWRQKGTGRARHGSIRSPIWIGGGVAHGPSRDVNFKKKVNKAQARAAFFASLTDRARDGHMIVVDALAIPSGKTRDAMTFIRAISKEFPPKHAGERTLIILPGTTDDVATRRAVENLPNIDAVRAQDLNVLTVLSYPRIVCAKAALEILEKTWH